MNQVVAHIEPAQRKSITLTMANKFGMDHKAFEATLRATVFKSGSQEEFAAFLLVANEYGLNPVTKEIYAFPAKGGGIIPVVSIDGWMNLINSHPAFDGMEFEEQVNDKGELVSTRCMIYRKDRTHPTAVTEYLSECIRSTEPWKMKHRMLRHKSAIQCARYAFGFAGIYDEDEADKIYRSQVRQDAPTPPLLKQVAPLPAAPQIAAPETSVADEPALDPAEPEDVFKAAEAEFAAAVSLEHVNHIWATKFLELTDGMIPPDFEHLYGIYQRAEERFAP